MFEAILPFLPRAIAQGLPLLYGSPGEIITLTVSNSSGEDIVVTTTFAAGQIQKLKTDGVWSILIPVSETATAGEFSMMVMALDEEETFPITIAPLS